MPEYTCQISLWSQMDERKKLLKKKQVAARIGPRVDLHQCAPGQAPLQSCFILRRAAPPTCLLNFIAMPGMPA